MNETVYPFIEAEADEGNVTKACALMEVFRPLRRTMASSWPERQAALSPATTRSRRSWLEPGFVARVWHDRHIPPVGICKKTLAEQGSWSERRESNPAFSAWEVPRRGIWTSLQVP